MATNQDWSPDGQHLAYTRNGWDRPDGANANIVRIDRHGKHQRELTHYTDGVTQAYLGSYSPDGQHLVMRLEDGKNMSLVITRRDATHPVTIMSDPNVEPHFITWGPAER